MSEQGCNCKCHQGEIPAEAWDALGRYYELGGCVWHAQIRRVGFYSAENARQFKREFPAWTVVIVPRPEAE